MTGKTFWNILDKQVVGSTLWKAGLFEYLRDNAADFLRTVFPAGSVLSETWPVTVTGTGDTLTLDVSPERRAVVEDAAGVTRLLLADSGSQYADVPFANAGGVSYYVAVKYAEIPAHVAQLAEPEVSGESAPFKFDTMTETIGVAGSPSAVVDLGGGTGLRFTLTTLAGPAWAAGKTRQAVIWLTAPETDSAEAFATVTIASSGSVLTATTSHYFGQVTPSLDAADYSVVVLGPLVTTVDPTGDTCALLAVVTTGVVDQTGQTVVMTGVEWTALSKQLRAFVLGLREGPMGFGENDRNGMGCYFGDADDQAWNDVTPTIPVAGVVKANFLADPFVLVDGAFAWLGLPGEQEMCTEADHDVDWTNYRYTPVNDGWHTICLQKQDATNEATPRYRATLITIEGSFGVALALGYLPLLRYDWLAGAFVGGTIEAERLADYRGDRVLESLGGNRLFLVDRGHPGAVMVRSSTYASKGTIEELLLEDGEGYSNDLVAFERSYRLAEGTHAAHVLKIAAQSNDSAQDTDAELTMLQLGGAGDLAVVGRTAGGVRHVAFARAATPVTDELLVLAETGGDAEDQIPAASGFKPVLRCGDFEYMGSGGKIERRTVPLGAVGDGWRTRVTAGPTNVLGPWLYGSLATAAQATLADVGNWWWLDVSGEFLTGADIMKPLYIEVPLRQRDRVYGLRLAGSVSDEAAGDMVLTWSLVAVDYTGSETEWIVSKGGAGNDWLDADVAELRTASAAGKCGAAHPNVGDAWVGATHAFAADVDLRWFVKFTPSVIGNYNKVSVRGVWVDIERLAP